MIIIIKINVSMKYVGIGKICKIHINLKSKI